MAIVSTTGGPVRGAERDSLAVFLGIPYAHAGRFRVPTPPTPWSDVRDALTVAPIAPQVGGSQFQRADLQQDEQCLSLNIWSPGLEGSRPVLVWLHGGGFRQGSTASPLYEGSNLARGGDAVVVTIQYRLGALGFLAHPDLADGRHRGNWGLLDQIEALRWVRDNIGAFGGDPGNVTIFGESAGAASVCLLCATADAQGLFHKAIAQSGAPMAVPLEAAARTAEDLARTLGVDIAGLRSIAAEAIVAAQPALGAGDLRTFIPCIDGGLFTGHPLDALAAGTAAGVPMIIGTNVDEWKLWAPADPHSRDLDEDHLLRRVERVLPTGADEAIALYRDARSARGERAEPNDLWFAIQSDSFFRVPAIRTAEAHGQAFVYLFGWGSPAMGGWLGSCHGLEIAFVFGTQGRAGLAGFTGSGADADALSTVMMDAWMAFARHGDPSTVELPWPVYDTSRRPTMTFDAKSALEDAPREPERALIDRLLPRPTG